MLAFKHTVLGFLLEFPTHGYKMMKKMFADFVPINPQVNEGRLYSTLKKLEQEQLIERQLIQQEDLPNQKIINITPLGKQEFDDWLNSTCDEEEHLKYDFFKQYRFLIKVNYFKHLSPEKIRTKLEKQYHICQSRLEGFQKARDNMYARGVDVYRIKIVEYGIEVEKVRISWLKELLEELKHRG